MSLVIQVENVSKQYRLGDIGTGALGHDINRFWHRIRGKEDPYLKIGEANDRSIKGGSEYVWSLQDIGFDIQQGDAVGIIGRNGAGKSTLLKILSRVTAPSTGSIKVKGRIASLLEVGTGFHPDLSGRENIFLNGAILGMRKHEIKRKFDEIVEFAGVERYIDTPVKRYSSGMYVRLAFAVAAHLESEILIVDEVLAVGDSEFQKKCLGKMGDVSRGEGRTVLFVSHNMAAVKNLCTKGIVLRNGRVIYNGNITGAVDVYTQNFNMMNKHSSVEIDDSYRRISNLREIEIISVEYRNPVSGNQYAVNDEITLLMKVKAKKAIEKFRVAFAINNKEENTVGIFFSEELFSILENEEQTIVLSIKDHQLAKGEYYFDLSVGVGNEVNGFRDFDAVTNPLSFEIVFKDTEHTEMISMWNANWGHINFQNVKVSSL